MGREDEERRRKGERKAERKRKIKGGANEEGRREVGWGGERREARKEGQSRIVGENERKERKKDRNDKKMNIIKAQCIKSFILFLGQVSVLSFFTQGLMLHFRT